jgi:predicted amino acid dehydrogenase
LDIPVTTGDSYTVAIAVQAIHEAARIMDIPLKQATAAVVGATGSIGSICAELLADDVVELILIGRREQALVPLRDRSQGPGRAQYPRG